jgi:hypothetical protein
MVLPVVAVMPSPEQDALFLKRHQQMTAASVGKENAVMK